MYWVTGFFAGWILFMAVRGYMRGVWITAFDLCGLFAGYVACFVWGAAVVALMQENGVAPHLALMGGNALLFAVVNLAVSFAPRLLLRKSLAEQEKLRWQGAGLGGFSGIISGLVFVWCFSFISGVVFIQKKPGGSVPAGSAMDKILVNSANSLVGSATEIGARASGVSEQDAKFIGAMTKSPKEFVVGMQLVSRSPELTSFMRDSHVQTLMATMNVDALLANYRFQALMHQEGMLRLRRLVETTDAKKLKEIAQPDESASVQLDRHIASQLSELWRRLAVLKNDPRVEKILKDDEVKKLINEKKPAALLANRKIQTLIKIVMEDNPDFNNIDYTQYVEEFEGQEENPEPGFVDQGELPALEIYRWIDGRGVTQYSEKSAIPEDRLFSAKLFK